MYWCFDPSPRVRSRDNPIAWLQDILKCYTYTTSDHTLAVNQPSVALRYAPHLHKRLDGLEALNLLVLGHTLGVERGKLASDIGVLLKKRPAQCLREKRGQ